MPNPLVLKYLSSKTNFVFIQTLFALFRDRYAVMTPSNFFYRPFWERYSLTKAKFCLGNPSNPAKTEKTHRKITLEQEINLVQIPHPSKATFKFPPPRALCPGFVWGGCWSFNLTDTLPRWCIATVKSKFLVLSFRFKMHITEESVIKKCCRMIDSC